MSADIHPYCRTYTQTRTHSIYKFRLFQRNKGERASRNRPAGDDGPTGCMVAGAQGFIARPWIIRWLLLLPLSEGGKRRGSEGDRGEESGEKQLSEQQRRTIRGAHG